MISVSRPTCPTRHFQADISKQTCPTRQVQPKINMPDSAQTRRSFIKDSASKTIIASHVAVVAGLINTPGIVNAVGGGTTTPQTTVVGHKKSTTTRSKSNGPVTGDPYAYWDSAKESALQKARAAATQVGNASIVDTFGQDEQSGVVSNNSVFNPRSLLKKAQIPVYNQKPAFRSNGPDLRQDE